MLSHVDKELTWHFLAVEGDSRVSRRVLLEACPALPAEAITALHALGDDQGVEDVVAALLGADQACPDTNSDEGVD